MHTRSRAKSPRERRRAVLVVAHSARALSAAARRARQAVIAIDAFRDLDTIALADESFRVPFEPDGFAESALLDIVKTRRARVSGLVYGSGFERSPALLAKLQSFVPLIGNPPDLVAAIKDPMQFSALLSKLGVPHPDTTREPQKGQEWLRKRVGGAGGGHIEMAAGNLRKHDDHYYYQRRVPGRAVSALFVADRQRADIIGFTEQWPDPLDEMPFRYGGCAGPIRLPNALAAKIKCACDSLVAATGLRGLNSFDFLVEDERAVALEVNPRPGATLDIFDGAGGLSLWRLHCQAIEGTMLGRHPDVTRARAAAILYAPDSLRIPERFIWPNWASDRGASSTGVNRNGPICTVRASAATAAAARERVAHRANSLLARLTNHRIL